MKFGGFCHSVGHYYFRLYAEAVATRVWHNGGWRPAHILGYDPLVGRYLLRVYSVQLGWQGKQEVLRANPFFDLAVRWN